MIAAYHFITAHWLALSIGGLLVFGIASNPVAALAFARKHWHLLLVALLLFVAYEMGAHTQKVADLFASTQAENAQLKALAHDLAAAQKAAAEAVQARDAARDKLAQYKPKVVERVRQNPSGCTLPRPVTDGLREQVRETNKVVSAASKPS